MYTLSVVNIHTDMNVAADTKCQPLCCYVEGKCGASFLSHVDEKYL